jgi:formyl-CoA transferase
VTVTAGSSGLGPLAGVRVLELGAFIAGPFAGQLLGDYGAEVIKVEPPDGGDPMRGWGVTVDGDSLWWPTIARNKASIVLDLRSEEDRQAVRRLAAQSDIVVENFRPGRLEEWGLGYDELSRDNPALVLVRVSGFGQTGPRAKDPGFGSIGEAMGGIRHTSGYPDRPACRVGISLGDSLASLFAVVGGLAALLEARASGIGQEVDVAIYEAVTALMESSMADFEIGGVLRGRSGSVLPGVAPSNVYATSDGAELVIAANADSIFVRLCDAMERPGLASDRRFATHRARGTNGPELDALISGWTVQHDSRELLGVLRRFGVPAGQIFTAADMLGDEHYRARDMVLRRQSEQGWDTPMQGVVPRFSRTPGSVRSVGPRLGAHTAEVLSRLGELGDEAARLIDEDGSGEES